MEELIEFITENNLQGLLIGLSTFLIIGIFHPLVIKGEYYLGMKMKWIFLLMGVIFLIFSILSESLGISALFGVASFSSFWGIKEVREQKERVKKGWFPANPKRNKELRGETLKKES